MQAPTAIVGLVWLCYLSTIISVTNAQYFNFFEREDDAKTADGEVADFNTPDFDDFGIGAQARGEANDDDDVEILVRYKTRKGKRKAEQRSKDKRAKKDLKRFHTVTIETKRSNIKELEDDPDIEAVALDQQVYVMGETQDVSTIDRVQEIHRQLQEDAPWGLSAVQADQVSQGTAAKPFVCVIDTGYGLGHDDLPNANTHGVDGYSWYFTERGNSAQLWDVDGHSHGTHCAGTIGAIGGNDEGVMSVNGDPNKFQFWIGKGLNNGGSGSTTAILAALDECIEAGKQQDGPIVVSMSYGCNNCYDAVTDKAYEDAYNEGALLIAAAGNNGSSDKAYPASYKSVMSVAAVRGTMYRASFSQFNDQVEIAAPGVGVLSTVTFNSGTEFGYATYSGTSMATPHVAGVAALLWSHFPQCTNHQLRNVLLRTAMDWGEEGCDDLYGYGIVQAKDAYDLIQSANGDCEAVGGTTPSLPSDAANGGCGQLNGDCSDCEGTCIKLSINTDDNPRQTRWLLWDRSSREWLEKVEYGTYTTANKLYTHNLCYPNTDFSMQVRDKSPEGLTGDGYYSLAVDGDTLVDRKSNFGSEDKVFFQGSSFLTPTEAPSACPGCTEVCIELSIKTDMQPKQIRWLLWDRSNREWLKTVDYGKYTTANKLYAHKLCYPDTDFSLKVLDKSPGGLSGNGYYSLVVDGKTIVDRKSDFGSEDRVFFTAPSPTAAPVPEPAPTDAPQPSSVPSEDPTLTTTSAPTGTAAPQLPSVPTEVPVPAPTAAPVPDRLVPVAFPTSAPVPAGACSGCTGTCIELSIKTDEQPKQIRWLLWDRSNREWLKTVKYGKYKTANKRYKHKLCYPNTAFALKVQDRSSDGLAGKGYYSLVVDGETIVDRKSNFGSADKVFFKGSS